MKIPATRLIFLMLLALLQACSSTQVQEAWRQPGYQPPHPQKILVVVLAANDSDRRVVENSFVAALEEKGQVAIASITWIPDGTQVTREALIPIVEQNGITSVLISSIRDIQKTAAYQPAPPAAGDDSLFRNIDTYYAYSNTGQHESGTYAPITEYLIETNLFDAASRKLSWSVITRTSAPKDMKKGIESVTKAVLKQARKDGVL